MGYFSFELKIGSCIITVLQGSRTSSTVYIHGRREIYFSESSHTIVEVGKSKISRAGRETRDPGQSWC